MSRATANAHPAGTDPMPIATQQLPSRLTASAIIALAALIVGCGNNEPAPEAPTHSTTAEPTNNQETQTPSDHQSDPNPSTTQPRTTEQGLTLTDLTHGTGEPVPADATATIEFTAWIVGQDEPFDSTERRRRPLTFSLDNHALIPGLRLGIEGMRPGGTRRIEIPATLAYGSTGRHPIPPDADLIYEVTLINWQPATN